jgi:hypothetical protein
MTGKLIGTQGLFMFYSHFVLHFCVTLESNSLIPPSAIAKSGRLANEDAAAAAVQCAAFAMEIRSKKSCELTLLTSTWHLRPPPPHPDVRDSIRSFSYSRNCCTS